MDDFELSIFYFFDRNERILVRHLHSSREGGRSQERVAASVTVRGMETENRRSERASSETRRFRGVRSSARHTASTTARLPGTGGGKYIIGDKKIFRPNSIGGNKLQKCIYEFSLQMFGC